MTALSAQVDMGLMAKADSAMGILGLSPMFVDAIDQIDWDPEPAMAQLEALQQAVRTVESAEPAVATRVAEPDCWEGDAADQAEDYTDCVRTWWKAVLDFLLGIVDWIVQLIDWILDILLKLVEIITWLATWVTYIAFVLVLAAAVFPPLAAAGPVLGKVFAWAGAIAAAGWLVGWIIKLLDWLVDRFQDLIRMGRDALCGSSVIPPTKPLDPDWGPLFPPDWWPPMPW